MTSRSQIEETVKALWVARRKNDLEGTIKSFADDGVFILNGRGTGLEALSKPTVGKAAIRLVMGEIVNTWHFKDWKQIDLLIDGEKALLHWSAHATFVPTKKSDVFDSLDLITFRDGKIVEYREHVDTALMVKVATPV